MARHLDPLEKMEREASREADIGRRENRIEMFRKKSVEIGLNHTKEQIEYFISLCDFAHQLRERNKMSDLI